MVIKYHTLDHNARAKATHASPLGLKSRGLRRAKAPACQSHHYDSREPYTWEEHSPAGEENGHRRNYREIQEMERNIAAYCLSGGTLSINSDASTPRAVANLSSVSVVTML